MTRALLLFLFFLPAGCAAQDGTPTTEREWSAQIARQWKLDPRNVCEVRTPDGSRVDILTETHAVEVEWAYKHYEAPTQAVFYAMAFNKKPKVVLLMRGLPSEKDKYLRCLAVCNAIRFRGEPIELEVFDTRKAE